MFKRNFLLIAFAVCGFCGNYASGQQGKKPATGKLFIIGGGNRSGALMQQLLQTAALGPKDYVIVLPMASAETDSAFYYISSDLQKITRQPVFNFNYTTDKRNNQSWLDSVTHAKLIYICGGDQSRFMKAVLHTPLYNAIHAAYRQGATIAGTSAGAAVMSRHMITGNQLTGDTAYHETFNKLKAGNIEFEEGMGLLDSIIIDQHFVKRSRYNRLLSALAAHPSFLCLGIDESTALIVQQKRLSIAGEGQVISFSSPKGLQTTPGGLIKFKGISMHIYTAGDVFKMH